MSLVRQGTGAPAWRKARRSVHNGDCVEVAHAGSEILVRDSKDPDAAMLGYLACTWRSFLIDTKNGKFDLLKLLIHIGGRLSD
jgi:hypothetical protein